MGLTACRSVPLHLLLYPSQPVCQGRALEKRIAAAVCTPRALASRRGLARNDMVRRGRRPAVERSGTNALGVRRPARNATDNRFVGADDSIHPKR